VKILMIEFFFKFYFLLQMLKHCATRMRIKFVQYEQSSQCKSLRDSSVSYASAVVTALT
jgi:predicted class III extradiol MEMO1 family dioxygenase